jgi:RHS repeat-associated protein
LGTFVYNLRFPGQMYQVETGLNQNFKRDYDSAVGGYVESDPIGLWRRGYSTYASTGANPISKIDPLGLQEVEIPGYDRPDNAREAAGYFDPNCEIQCISWLCFAAAMEQVQ